jgi:hypothetical protein
MLLRSVKKKLRDFNNVKKFYKKFIDAAFFFLSLIRPEEEKGVKKREINKF